MEESRKTEMRNNLMGAGFFIASAIYFLISLPNDVGGDQVTDPMLSLSNIINTGALLLIVVGIILAFLRKRDLTAITFLMVGAILLLIGKISGIESSVPSTVLGIFTLILSAIILVSKDEKKYLLFLIPGIIGIRGLLMPLTPPFANIILNFVFGLLLLYFAFACVSERISLPFSKILTTDVETDFRVNGSVIGYLCFGVTSAMWAGIYLTDINLLGAGANFNSVAGIMMIISGILLLVIGKMRFTPVMFILMGFIASLYQFNMSVIYIAVFGALNIIIGLFAMLKNKSRILPGGMLILYGVACFASIFVTTSPTDQSMMVVIAVMNGIVSLISVYIAFAVFSNKKLPLF